jgi:S-adenosylmethionine decarboxylase proenzyme
MENKPTPFYPGQHILIDYYGCSVEVLNDALLLEKYLLETAYLIGATVVSVQFNAFNPIGVSGVVIIAESHLTIHTWPELGYAAVDFFTCGFMDTSVGLGYLEGVLEAKEVEVKKVERLNKNLKI